jgi:two-component system response regulator RegX3
MVDMACTSETQWDKQGRILLVEDGEFEAGRTAAITAALRAEGYDVELATDAADGLQQFASNPPALVLLQTSRPGTRWIRTCRQMQAIADVPIIIGARQHSQIDIVLAFEFGVVGYITDPSRSKELIARVRAALRVDRTIKPRQSSPRDDGSHGHVRLDAGDLSMDLAGREVTLAGCPVHLPKLEFDLLALLLSPPGQVRTRSEIFDKLWPHRELEGSRTLDTHVRRLRRKLEDDPARPRRLVTVRGVGFRFDTSDNGTGS